MPDDHDATSYTANGPTDAGFRTGGDGTGITDGVVASGIQYGIHGIGLGTPEGQPGNSAAETIGVFGQSSTGYGVKGASDNWSGVRGFSKSDSGVRGTSSDDSGVMGDGPIGVRGIANGEPTKNTSQLPLAGVLGESDDERVGSGVGVYGRSKRGRGGVFEAEAGAAQLRLVPKAGYAEPPKTGQAGDLLVLPTPPIPRIERKFVQLWFCLSGDSPGQPAIWGKVAFN